LVLKLVILNAIVAIILRYFTKSGHLGASYVTVIEIRPMLSVTTM